MGRELERITPELTEFLESQHLFFVATAPESTNHHVNVSPKGPIGSLRIVSPLQVAYLDIVGSGAETVAHLRENGRIVIMLCAFEGPPRIVRLHGRGSVVGASDPRFEALVDAGGFAEPAVPEMRRSVVLVELERIADSCGYGVPLMTYKGQRPHSELWAEKKLRVGVPDALLEYQRAKNLVSIDGLPAVELPVPVAE